MSCPSVVAESKITSNSKIFLDSSGVCHLRLFQRFDMGFRPNKTKSVNPKQKSDMGWAQTKQKMVHPEKKLIWVGPKQKKMSTRKRMQDLIRICTMICPVQPPQVDYWPNFFHFGLKTRSPYYRNFRCIHHRLLVYLFMKNLGK